MKRYIAIVIPLLPMLFADASLAGAGIECVDEMGTARCVNRDTKTRGDFSFTPSYKITYPMYVLPMDKSCDVDQAITDHTLPKGTLFKQTTDYEAHSEKEMIVHVYKVDQLNGGIDATEKAYFNEPFRVCHKGKNAVEKSYYKRIGGLSTGLLVVPFKLRDGDIYSDAAIGQYISYKWEVVEILATAGLSQISISEVGSEEIESKTGITVALGVNFEIAKDWDIAFLAGADHLSGEDGDNWEFQDDTWVSFAIGFNFTR